MPRQLAVVVVSVVLLLGTGACSAIGGGGGGGSKNVHGVTKNYCRRKPSSPKCAP